MSYTPQQPYNTRTVDTRCEQHSCLAALHELRLYSHSDHSSFVTMILPQTPAGYTQHSSWSLVSIFYAFLLQNREI